MAEAITVFYGAATRDDAQAITLRRGAPLRLSDGLYPFAETPDLIRLAATAARLDFLREHLRSLCGLWAKPPLQFLDAYFAWIGATLAAAPAQPALTAAGHGLFAPEDWSFAALRPLPSALLPAGDDAIRADFAFWTGAGFVAVELPGERRAQRRGELARFGAAGVTVLELAPADLADAAALGVKLPAAFGEFWRGLALPRSPFGTRDLAIAPAR
ncbi:MAG: hypothetical protein KGL22_01975 [Alphaproteobacteria bacterium]|nr:hypothetical protein [Alphaproteobacteria bacterium]